MANKTARKKAKLKATLRKREARRTGRIVKRKPGARMRGKLNKVVR